MAGIIKFACGMIRCIGSKSVDNRIMVF